MSGNLLGVAAHKEDQRIALEANGFFEVDLQVSEGKVLELSNIGASSDGTMFIGAKVGSVENGFKRIAALRPSPGQATPQVNFVGVEVAAGELVRLDITNIGNAPSDVNVWIDGREV